MEIQKKEVQLEKIESFAFNFSKELLALAVTDKESVVNKVYFELEDVNLLTKAYIITFLSSITIDKIKSGSDFKSETSIYFKALSGFENEDILQSLDYFMENLAKEVPSLSNNRMEILSVDARKQMIECLSDLREDKQEVISQIIRGELDQLVIKSNVDKKIKSSMH